MLIQDDKRFVCFFAFGSTSKDAVEYAADLYGSDQLKASNTITLCNPLPTGDHWKVIGWVDDYIRKGSSTLSKLSQPRRDFVKMAADALSSNKDICFEIVSMAARKYRDDNELRMQRGKVYVTFKKK